MDVSWDDLGRPTQEGDYPFQGREIRVTQHEIGIWHEHPTAVFAVTEFEPLSGKKSYVLGGYEVRKNAPQRKEIDRRLLEYLRRTFPSLLFELVGDGLGVSARNPNSPRRERELQIEVEGDNFRATTTSASTANPDFGETELFGSPQELEQYIQRFFAPPAPEQLRTQTSETPLPLRESRAQLSERRQPRLRARTKTGRAVLRNQIQIALSSEALLLLIDEKVASLESQRPNSDEATAVRDESMAEFERLKQSLREFRASTFAFLTGEGKERSVERSSNAFLDGLSDWWSKRHVQICDRAFDMSLFLGGVGLCSLLEVGAPLAAVICGPLVGGKPVADAISAYFKTHPRVHPDPGRNSESSDGDVDI